MKTIISLIMCRIKDKKIKRGYPELRNSEHIWKRANHSQTEII